MICLLKRLTIVFLLVLGWLVTGLLGFVQLAQAHNDVDPLLTILGEEVLVTQTLTTVPDFWPTILPETGVTAPVLEVPGSLDITLTGLRPAEITPEYVDWIAGNEIKHGNREQANIALTFDCEGTEENITEVLQILKTDDTKATFFLEGITVEQKPHLVPLILAQGHELGNHSYSHPHFSTLTQTEIISEITRTEDLISTAAGQPVPMRFFRFPYGGRTPEIRQWVAQLGYQSAFWDVDAKGWKSTITTTDVISTITNTVKPGSIVIMHCSAAADRKALPTVITALKARGYSFEILSAVVKEDEN